MEISSEKIEHPARRAARMIRELHEQNLKLIAEGQVFLKDGVDVTQDIASASAQQIELCNAIMARAEHMDPALHKPSGAILEQLQTIVDEANAKGETLACIMPEIGNFDHEENS